MTTWSKYQTAFFENVASGTGHTVLDAVAGSGKTTAIMEGLTRVPAGLRTILVAFNKPIAENLTAEIRKRRLTGVEASTLHSYGMRTITGALGRDRVRIDKNRMHHLIDEMTSEAFEVVTKIAKSIGEDMENADLSQLRFDLIKTVSLAKGSLAGEENQIDQIIDDFGIDFPRRSPFQGIVLPEELQDALQAAFIRDVLTLLIRCSDLTDGAVDFDDMIWLPIVLDLRQTQYDRVFIDECLPGPTPILLADGSSRTIQDLVESKYSGDVLAYDPVTGKQRPCRVTGWQTILNQKPLVKIKARWSRKKGTNTPTNFIVCTEDHKIWANGAWVPAVDVRPGMVLQVETSAEKSQFGKITTRGRVKLAGEISRKNSDGIMVNPVPTGFRGTRGGNGKEPTVPERALMEALGDGWIWQHAVPTKKPRGRGYPTAYKIDIANPVCKIAVEVDGKSHHLRERREQDARRDRLLKSLGWTVVRVPNRRAVQNAKEEAELILAITNCPIDAIVESVEPVTIPSFHVYDLTVEDLHCFYANGILVHNCQDLNPAQIEMSLRSVKPNGRICAVGDPRQAIYRFRGADSAAMGNVVKRLNATVLPLSVCYRCCKSVIKEAQKIVPHIEWAPGAEEGLVEDATVSEMKQRVRPGQFILSRTNAPLVSLCMQFLKEGRSATIQGRDIGSSLAAFVKKSAAGDVTALRNYIEEWRDIECKRLSAKRRDTQSVEDRAECILALSEEARSVQDVINRIESLFADKGDSARIMLSSTHKAKGQERDTVWMLADTYGRKPDMEEKNLIYVAQTRARKALYLVHGDTSRRGQ